MVGVYPWGKRKRNGVVVQTVRKRVVVRGRVQGVWFRQSTQTQALALGLTGWVRNREDGSVEAVFEGSAWDVDEMIEWCRQGPPRASVEDILIAEEEPEGLIGFRITG